MKVNGRIGILVCLVTLAAVVSFAVAMAAAAQRQTEAILQPGRFQLFEGRSKALVKTGPDQGTALDIVEVFKIDSQTGQTWIFRQIAGDDGVVIRWHPIGD